MGSVGCFGQIENIKRQSLISDSEGIVFTANIDGIHGMKSGFEVGCILQGEDLDKAREYAQKLIGE